MELPGAAEQPAWRKPTTYHCYEYVAHSSPCQETRRAEGFTKTRTVRSRLCRRVHERWFSRSRSSTGREQGRDGQNAHTMRPGEFTEHEVTGTPHRSVRTGEGDAMRLFDDAGESRCIASGIRRHELSSPREGRYRSVAPTPVRRERSNDVVEPDASTLSTAFSVRCCGGSTPPSDGTIFFFCADRSAHLRRGAVTDQRASRMPSGEKDWPVSVFCRMGSGALRLDRPPGSAAPARRGSRPGRAAYR